MPKMLAIRQLLSASLNPPLTFTYPHCKEGLHGVFRPLSVGCYLTCTSSYATRHLKTTVRILSHKTPALSSYRLFRRNGLKRFDNGPSKSASCPLGSPKSGVACVKSPPPLKQIREGGAAPWKEDFSHRSAGTALVKRTVRRAQVAYFCCCCSFCWVVCNQDFGKGGVRLQGATPSLSSSSSLYSSAPPSLLLRFLDFFSPVFQREPIQIR